MTKYFTVSVKLLITIGLLSYCLIVVDISNLSATFVGMSGIYIVFAIALMLVDIAVGAYRFKVLFDPLGHASGLTHLKWYFWASFFNLVLPGSVGGDAMRVFWLNGAGQAIPSATLVILVERLLGVFALLLLISIASLIGIVPAAIEQWLWVVYICVTASTIFFVVALAIPSRAFTFDRRFAAEIWESWGKIRPRLPLVLVLTLAYQFMTVGVTIVLAQSIDVNLSAASWLVAVPLIWLFVLLPITVGGFGLREIGFIVLLGAYGIAKESALAVALLTYLTFFVGGAIGGIWYSLKPGGKSKG